MKKLSKKQQKWIERTVANDRSYKILVYNRFFVCALAFVAQLLIFVLSLSAFSSVGWVVELTFGVCTVAFVLYVISRDDYRPTKVSWIILILAFPLVGASAYFLYGNGNSTHRLKTRYDRASAALEKLPQDEDALKTETENGRNGQLSFYLSARGAPVYADGDVEYFPTGKAAFASMKTALENATDYVLMEYFIVAGGKMWKEILEILLRKAAQGVKIKIIYDDFGSILVLPPRYARYLESLHENVQCLAFNPVRPIFSMQTNHRDHRKILVVDGKVAYTGGMNIADEYVDEKKRFGYWKDSAVKLTGSPVRSLVYAFLQTWKAYKDADCDPAPYLDAVQPSAPCTGCIQPFIDGPTDGEWFGETVYLDMINRAKEYVYITTPYLALDDVMRLALSSAAKRGVDVRIVTPAVPDKKTVYRLTRANYGALLCAGVKIYEYTPGFIHAKNVVSDGYAVVGTINFDYRSFYHHFENAVYFSHAGAVAQVKRDFEETVAVSRERNLDNYKRNFFGKVFDSVLRFVEPLL